MKHDIPKYDNTGLFLPGAKEKWNNFLSSFESEYRSMSLNPIWILDQFKPVNERCPNIPAPLLDPKVVKKSQAEKETRKVCIK